MSKATSREDIYGWRERGRERERKREGGRGGREGERERQRERVRVSLSVCVCVSVCACACPCIIGRICVTCFSHNTCSVMISRSFVELVFTLLLSRLASYTVVSYTWLVTYTHHMPQVCSFTCAELMHTSLSLSP